VISTSSISGPGSISRVGSIGGAFPLVEQAASVASCRVETTVCLSGVGSISGALPLVEQAASVASCRVETTAHLCVGVISTSSISEVSSIGG